jgi:U4/U6.U5 tri-snRNP-associated protein 1
VKNKRELYSSLKGTTLGDPDGDEEDTLKWIKKSKKKQKLLAQKKQEELAKMDQEFLGEYTERTFVIIGKKAQLLI